MSTQDTTLPPPEHLAGLVKDIHNAIGELAGCTRYPDLTEAIDKLAAIAAQAQQPIKLRGTPRKADYLEGARFYALMYGQYDDAPGYLPRTREQADQFKPHAWVLSAMMQAFGDGWADGHSAGLDLMKQAQQPNDVALCQALEERDAASDYIDTLLDEVLGADRPEWSSAYGHADAMRDVRERMTALHKPKVDKAWAQFQAGTHHAQQADEFAEGPTPEQIRDEHVAQQAQGVPACHKVSPYEPTQEMLIAAKDIDPALPIEHVRRLWWLMWAAAPQAEPPASAQTDHIADASKLVEQAQGMPEPRGWIVWWPRMGGGHVEHWHSGARKPSFGPELDALLKVEPVYAAAPQAEPEPEREPLTDEQMWELWNSQGIDEMNQKEAVTFARAIERAHGIGTKGGAK